MKFFLINLALVFCGSLFSQQTISGKVTEDNDFLLTSVLVINITQNKKTYTNSLGEFSIDGAKGDEIRFVKDKYERSSIKITADFNIENLHIVMLKIPEIIEEVEIVKLSGDLSKDSQKMAKRDKVQELQNAIGLPRPPEIMREKIPTVKEAFGLGLGGSVGLSMNIDALYKNASGYARRKRSEYKFDDSERYIKWILDRVDPNYFTEAGIPDDKIKEFLGFALTENAHILTYVKQKNIDGAIFNIEKTIPKFVERLKSN